jgi:hypothetical protein
MTPKEVDGPMYPDNPVRALVPTTEVTANASVRNCVGKEKRRGRLGIEIVPRSTRTLERSVSVVIVIAIIVVGENETSLVGSWTTTVERELGTIIANTTALEVELKRTLNGWIAMVNRVTARQLILWKTFRNGKRG